MARDWRALASKCVEFTSDPSSMQACFHMAWRPQSWKVREASASALSPFMALTAGQNPALTVAERGLMVSRDAEAPGTPPD